MPRMIPDAKLLFDEAGDAAPRPEGTAKAERFRPLGQQVRKLGTLRWAQPGGRPGGGMVPQRRHALHRGPFEPLTDRPLGDAQGFRDAGLRPAPLVQFPGTQAAPFVPTQMLVRICCAHTWSAQHIPAHDY